MSATPNKDSKPSGQFSTMEQAGASDSDLTRVHTVLTREKPEPVEGYSPIPIFLIFLFSALIFWAGVYLEKFNGGKFDPLVYNHRLKGDASAGAAVVALTPDSPDWIKRGQRLYQGNCQACHGAEGNGVPGAFPPLVGSEWVVGEKSEQLLPRILLYGLQGAVKVKGLNYDGNMPAQTTYTDAQIAQVSSFIRAQWGNSAPPISDTAVAEIRKVHGKRGPWDGPSLLQAVGATQ